MYLNDKLPKSLQDLYKKHHTFNKSAADLNSSSEQQQQKMSQQQQQQQQLQQKIEQNVQMTQQQNEGFANNTGFEQTAQTTTNQSGLQQNNGGRLRPLYTEKFQTPVKYSSLAQRGVNGQMFKNNPFVKFSSASQQKMDGESDLNQQQQYLQGSGDGNQEFFEFIEPSVREFKDLHPGLHESFIYMIIGPPKSGKTNLLNKIIQGELFYGCSQGTTQFDKIIFISPSILPGFKLREGYNYSQKLDLFTLYNMLSAMDQEYQQSSSFRQSHIKGHLLLVFDDCIGEMSGVAKKREFQNLFNNRRQILVSLDIQIIATSQSSNGLPAFIRKISTGLFIFQVLGAQEYKTIMDENIPKRYKEPFKSILNEYLKDKYSYIFISKYPFEIYSNSPTTNKLNLIQMF